MSRWTTSLLLATLAAGPAEAELRVVASIPDLGAVAREIGGGRVEVVVLSLPTQDPHWVDARPNLALELSKADLLLYAGMELEIGWLPTLIVGSRNTSIQSGATGNLDCSRFVQPMEVPAQRVDRSMGDVHPLGNPHYFYDPRAMLKVVAGIGEKLAELDPAGAAEHRAGARKLAAKIEAQLGPWAATLAAAKGARFVDYHHAWPYVADWLGLVLVGDIEPRPGIPPSPAHVARLIGQAKSQGVQVVLQEVYHPPTTAQLLAQKTGAQVVVVPGGADFAGGEGYVERINRFVGLLARGLKGG